MKEHYYSHLTNQEVQVQKNEWAADFEGPLWFVMSLILQNT